MSRPLRILLILSLLVNIFVISWMGLKWMRRYQKQEWLLIQQRMTQLIEPQSYIFLGDSQLDNLFHSGMISRKVPIQNLAFPGFRAADVIEYLAKTDPEKTPVRVFLLAGINDLRSGQSLEFLFQVYKEMAPLLKEKFPAGEIIVLSLFPILETQNGNPGATNEKIGEVNAHLKKWCDENRFIFLDSFDLLSHNGQLNAEWTYDGLHLNTRGNREIARLLGGYWKELP